MITLGIETSCDETALCLLETQGDEYKIIANIVHSQIELHKEYGGVFPMLAKREHIKNLPILYKKLLEEAKITETEINAIAVTQGPGLEPALWTGIVFAKELGKKLSVPVIPVNHMEGHIVSTLLKNSLSSLNFEKLKPLEFPSLALLISGGHTEIVMIKDLGNYKILGRTMDDAVGEAFDKTARMLGLPYPGGPEISKMAEEARKINLPKTISLPRPMIHSKNMDFSFSGLKTAVLYTIKEIGELSENQKREICWEFEDAVTEVLVSKVRKALEENEYKILIIGGGVVANRHIRKAFESLAKECDVPLYLPADGLTGDNALMIALAGSLRKNSDTNFNDDFKADGNLSLNSSRKDN